MTLGEVVTLIFAFVLGALSCFGAIAFVALRAEAKVKATFPRCTARHGSSGARCLWFINHQGPHSWQPSKLKASAQNRE